MKKFILKFKKQFLVQTILSLLAAISMVYGSWTISDVMNGVIAGDIRSVLFSSVKWIAIWLVTLFFTWAINIYGGYLKRRMNNSLREMMVLHIWELEPTIFLKNGPSKYSSWFINNVKQIEDNTFEALFDLIYKIFLIVFSFIALVLMHWALALIAIILFFITFIIPKLFEGKMKQEAKILSNQQGVFTKATNNYLGGYTEFKNNNLFTTFKSKVAETSDKIELEKIRFLKLKEKTDFFISLTNVIAQISVIVITAIFAVQGFVTVGIVFSIGNILNSFFNSAISAFNSYVLLKSSESLFEEMLPEINESKERTSDSELLNHGIETIVGENVSYSYGEKYVLNGVSFKFERGGKYIIVGSSGSGKTTLVKILMGYLSGYSGNIVINDKKLEMINPVAIRNSSAYITQDTYLFNDTIRNNITLWKDTEPDLLASIIEKANLKEFINKLPEGLDTVIEENSINISGGERQRISLARVLLSSKRWIFIDEGTSALDRKNAREIERILFDNSDLGVVMITHNLSEETRNKADSIVELSPIND